MMLNCFVQPVIRARNAALAIVAIRTQGHSPAWCCR
jgi:hypothetical protein